MKRNAAANSILVFNVLALESEKSEITTSQIRRKAIKTGSVADNYIYCLLLSIFYGNSEDARCKD